MNLCAPERVAAMTVCSKVRLRGLTSDKPGRDKHPSWAASRRRSGYLAKCFFFFVYLLCSFCHYLLAASRPSADLTGKSFWLLQERSDRRPRDGKEAARIFFFYCHSKTCIECKGACAMPALRISGLRRSAMAAHVYWCNKSIMLIVQ